MTNADATDARIDEFLARFSAPIEAELRAARAHVRALFPRGFELVFDNTQALVFGFGASERSRDAFLSIAGYPRWVTLFFLRGIDLDDPHRLLRGEGKQVRSVRLTTAADLQTANVAALIEQALRTHAAALRAAPPLSTRIAMAVASPRPRRPAEKPPRPPRDPRTS